MFCDTMYTMKKLLLGLIFVLRITCAFGEPDVRDPAQVVTEVPGSAYTIFKAPTAGGILVSTGVFNRFTFEILGTDCALEWNGTDFVCAGTGLTVREVDLAPSIADVVLLEFDQTDGFIVSNPASNRAKVALGAPVGFTDTTNTWTLDQTFSANVFISSLAMTQQGQIEFRELAVNGTNAKAFKASAAVTATTVCTFEDDANFIPDSCIGDGSDGNAPNTCSAGNALVALGASSSTCDPNVAFDDESNVFSVNQTIDGDLIMDNRGLVIFNELDANGNNGLALQAPAAVTTSQTCLLENDANFIPDSCVGNGTDDVGSLSGSATLNFADPGQNACTATQNITVTGATAGHACAVGPANATTSIIYDCNVTANTCAIKACKFGNAAEDPASQTYFCSVF